MITAVGALGIKLDAFSCVSSDAYYLLGGGGRFGVAVTVNILFPAKPEGAGRFETEEDMRAFFGPVAEYLGHGGEGGGWPAGSTDVLLAIPDGEDVEGWVARMCDFLRTAGARRGTFLAVFPNGPLGEWQRVDVYGSQRHAEPGSVSDTGRL
jgi:hypothetical protein